MALKWMRYGKIDTGVIIAFKDCLMCHDKHTGIDFLGQCIFSRHPLGVVELACLEIIKRTTDAFYSPSLTTPV